MTKQRRILALLTVIALFITAMPLDAVTAAIEEIPTAAVIAVQNENAMSGTDVDVDIIISNNPGILGMTLKLEYDETLATLTDVKSGEALDKLTFTPLKSLKSGCNLAWDGLELADEDVKNGVVATLTFKVSENAKPGDKINIKISADKGAIVNQDVAPIAVEKISGYIQVIDYIPGDVNGDGLINTTDVVVLRRFIADGCQYVEEGYAVKINSFAADVNNDGLINTTDAIFIRRYIADGCKYDPDGYGVQLKPSEAKCDHTMESTVAKEATCTEAGNNAFWHCTTCDKYFSDENGNAEITLDSTVIPATGHTVVIDPAVEPTYTATGLTEGSHCDVCGTVIVAQEEIPALVKNEYSITYHIANNDNYLAQLEIENPNPATYTAEDGLELQNLIVDGYTFEGWFDGAGSNAKQVKEIAVGTTGSKTLYAHWSLVEYTVSFDCPLNPIPDATYTVDRGVTLANPEWFGYTFVGWSDNDGNLVSSINQGTTGNITLKANWTSARNQTRAVGELKDPIIYEDEENGQILFTYEIGTIENVPLYTLKDLGRSVGYTVTESETVTKSINEVTAESIAQVIANATTKSSSWTLSKDWNKTTTFGQDIAKQYGQEVYDKIVNAASSNSDYKHFVSNGNEFGYKMYDENGATAKVNTNATETTTQNPGGIKGFLDDLELGVEVSTSDLMPVEIGASASFNVGSLIPGEDKSSSLTTNTDSESKYLHTEAIDYKAFMNTESSKVLSETSSSSHETSKRLSSMIAKNYHYGETYSEGGSQSETQALVNSTTESREYATALTYSNGITTTVTKTYSNDKAPYGYYRLVLAGKIHVFAVVGYDISSHTYFTYTYNVMDDEKKEFMDYSATTSSFDDYENGVIPFEIPYEVHEYVSEMIGESEGLVIDVDTGKIVGYNGNETDNAVIIPWYKTVDNGDGTNTVVKVTGFESDVFAGNKKLAGIKLGKYVTEIPDSAFEGCTSLDNVVYSSIDSIGNNAFAGCTSLADVTVPAGVTSLGANAFNDVPKVTVNSANSNVAENAVYSGAKQLILNLSPLTDELGNKNLKVSPNTDHFEFNGNGRTYNNLCVTSDATTTVINGATFENTSGIPFTFSSENVTLNRVNATSQGLTMILSSDKTNVGLFGTVKLTSNSGNAVLSKNMNLSWSNPGVAGSMDVSGNVLVCGEIDGMSNLKVSNGTIKYITQEEFDQWNNFHFVYFDPNGGTVNETSRQINHNSSLGVLPVPTKTGYTFDGWFTADNVKVTSDTVFSSNDDITLVAKWTVKSYTASWAAGAGCSIVVTRTSSPYAGAPTGPLYCDAYRDAIVYYGDVLSVSYNANDNYHITTHGVTSLTVTGYITGALIYAGAELNENHVRTVTGYAGTIHYYMEVYTAGNQLHLKGCAYDTTNHSAQLRIDIDSKYATVADLYDTSCAIGGYHGFDYMCGPYYGGQRIRIHTFSPSTGDPILLWDSMEDAGFPQHWVNFPD